MAIFVSGGGHLNINVEDIVQSLTVTSSITVQANIDIGHAIPYILRFCSTF